MIKLDKYEELDISAFKGEVLTDVVVNQNKTEILFTFESGQLVKMHHMQDCCEDVWLEDVCGDWEDLIGRKITYAREDSHRNEAAEESETWTFYNIGSDFGSVSLRWCGQSNGYYSEEVDLKLFQNKRAYKEYIRSY